MSVEQYKSALAKVKKSKNQIQAARVPTEIYLKIHDLQQYISSIFTNCSMPPLNEFLELGEIENHQFRLKLQAYNNQPISEQDKMDYVYFLESGKIFITKNNQLDSEETHRSSKERMLSSTSKSKANQTVKKDKSIEIKEDNFFMLSSFRKNSEIQHFSISSHQNGQFKKCLIGKIKINPIYSISWYIAESQKHQFLSTFLQTDDFSISQHKLKGLCRFFKMDNFKRGATLIQQGQDNDRLFFFKSGECQFSKTFTYQFKNHSELKILKVANGGPKTILGSQFLFYEFMGSSKSISTATKAMNQIENKVQKIKLKFYDKSINNFTVCVLSGYAQVYHIQVSKFKQLCEKYVPEVPQQLRKVAEANYITLLRTAKQKIHLQLIKIQRNENKLDQQRVQAEAKMKSGYFQQELGLEAESPERGGSQSPIKLRRSQFIQTNLQGSEVQKIRTKRLEKKIQILLQAKKSPIDYKKKIEIVLKQKLNAVKPLENDSGLLSNREQKIEKDEQTSRIRKDLQSIFMNNESNYRTNSISRQNYILAQKQGLLKRRYSSVDNMLIVHQDHYDRNKNKLFRMDLIQRGLKDQDQQMEKNMRSTMTVDFSARTKKECIEKINKANKIKQQFMIIRSQCENCHCYDDIQGYMSAGGTHKSIKEQATKTGSAWRTSFEPKNNIYQQPLEKLHSRVKLISQRASRKYQHNVHLLQKKRRFVSGSQRKFSAPQI